MRSFCTLAIFFLGSLGHAVDIDVPVFECYGQTPQYVASVYHTPHYGPERIHAAIVIKGVSSMAFELRVEEARQVEGGTLYKGKAAWRRRFSGHFEFFLGERDLLNSRWPARLTLSIPFKRKATYEIFCHPPRGRRQVHFISG